MSFPIRDVLKTLKNLNRHEIWWFIKHLPKAPGVWEQTKLARE